MEEDRAVQPFECGSGDREGRFGPGGRLARLLGEVLGLGGHDQGVRRSGFDPVHLDAADEAGEAFVDAPANARLLGRHGDKRAVLSYPRSLWDLSVVADLRLREIERGVETVGAVATEDFGIGVYDGLIEFFGGFRSASAGRLTVVGRRIVVGRVIGCGVDRGVGAGGSVPTGCGVTACRGLGTARVRLAVGLDPGSEQPVEDSTGLFVEPPFEGPGPVLHLAQVDIEALPVRLFFRSLPIGVDPAEDFVEQHMDIADAHLWCLFDEKPLGIELFVLGGRRRQALQTPDDRRRLIRRQGAFTQGGREDGVFRFDRVSAHAGPLAQVLGQLRPAVGLLSGDVQPVLHQGLRRLGPIVAGRSDSFEDGERDDRQRFRESVQGLESVDDRHGIVGPHGAGEIVEIPEQDLEPFDALGDLRSDVLEIRPAIFVEQRMGVGGCEAAFVHGPATLGTVEFCCAFGFLFLPLRFLVPRFPLIPLGVGAFDFRAALRIPPQEFLVFDGTLRLALFALLLHPGLLPRFDHFDAGLDFCWGLRRSQPARPQPFPVSDIAALKC